MPERKVIKHYLWLIWLGVIFSLGTVALIGVNLNRTLKAESEAAFQQNLAFLAESSAKSIKLFFDGVISEIVLLSEIDAVKEYRTNDVDLAFRGVISKHNEHISHMILMDDSGEVKVMVTKDPNPFQIKSQVKRFYNRIKTGWRVDLSRQMFSSDTYRGVAVGMPIFRKFNSISKNSKGKVPSFIYASGALIALVGADDLVEHLIDPIGKKKGGMAWLYFGKSQLLANNDTIEPFARKLYGYLGSVNRLKNEFGKIANNQNVDGWSRIGDDNRTMVVESFNEKWFISTAQFRILDQDWTFAVAAPQSEATHFLDTGMIQTMALFGFVVVILLTGGYLMTRLNQSRIRAEEKGMYASELEEKNRSLRALTKRMDEFLAVVSHDIRSPLSVIIGFIKMIQSGPSGKQLERETRTMLRSSNRLMQLVSDILDVSRLEAGKVALAYETIVIDTLINESVKTMELSAIEKDQEMTVELGESTSMDIDGAKFLQVMNNLIANAIKFTPKKGKICVMKNVENGNAHIAISDTGPGIPTEEIGMVFDKFEQLKHHQQGIEPGSGLGLTICKNIVDLHGGEITVTNNPGGGSTFCVILPIQPPFKVGVGCKMK